MKKFTFKVVATIINVVEASKVEGSDDEQIRVNINRAVEKVITRYDERIMARLIVNSVALCPEQETPTSSIVFDEVEEEEEVKVEVVKCRYICCPTC